MFPEKHFMERLFTPDIAGFYEKFYADKGVTIKAGDTVTAFEGSDGQVCACAACRWQQPAPLPITVASDVCL